VNVIIKCNELLKFEGYKSNTVHTNIQINRPKWHTCRNGWATTKAIFNYTDLPGVKMLQRSFRQANFFDSHCRYIARHDECFVNFSCQTLMLMSTIERPLNYCARRWVKLDTLDLSDNLINF